MKKSIFFLLLFVLIMGTSFADVIGSDLSKAMNNDRNGEFRVIIELKDQVNSKAIMTQNKFRGSQRDVKNQIIDMMKKKCQESQKWVKAFIGNVQRSAQIKNVHSFWIVNAISLETNETVIRQLALQEDIKGIYLDKEQVMINPIASSERASSAWGVNHIHADGVDLGKHDVIVAVVDTGINLNHKEFADKQIQVGLCKSFVDGEADAEDGNGHGTHCAGTIGSEKYGVAPGVKLIAVKVLSASGSGTWTGVMNGVQYAAEHADIMSMSLGGTASSSGNTVEKAVQNAIDGGVVCVIAAGNSGPGSSTIGTPGVVWDAITVGAIDNKEVIASFSSRGPTVYGTEKPDIVAPGVNIPSLWKSGGTKTISGTSMATPHVAGLVALILSRNPNFTPAQVKKVVMTKVFGEAKANVYGTGCVDAVLATE
jgi:serine protease AprX